MRINSELLKEIEKYAGDLIMKESSETLTYHTIDHTRWVVKNAGIMKLNKTKNKNLQLLQASILKRKGKKIEPLKKENPAIILPTVIFNVFSLSTIRLAILSTRTYIPSVKFTKNENMYKSILAIALLVLLTFKIYAQQADIIVGRYSLPNNLDIEIYENSGKYFGKIIALNGFENGQLKDINNPDRSKRNDPLLEKLIIKDLEYDIDAKKWINGSMYGAEKGLYFNLLITEVRANEIAVVGSKFIMRKSVVWKKL